MTRVLFLMSDTGGGHRAAAEAIASALQQRYGAEQIETELVDVFRVAHFPINYMPEFYPWLIRRSKRSWGLSYNLSNGNRRAAVLSRTMYMTNAKRLKTLVRNKQPIDVVVCVHSVIARPALQAFLAQDERPPFINVVTDLVSTHWFWYDARADVTLVPTQAAYDRGLECKIPDPKLKLTGLPVHPSFLDSLHNTENARQELGWEPDKMTILMVAGGEGMGPLYQTARAINDKHLDCQLVIVAGRNKTLKARLDQADWNQPTHIYPFVQNMPQLMKGADIIVTKAGPATITEAAIAGLPMIISDAIPGQEEGNVRYVVEHDAGAFAPEPQQVADVVQQWVTEGKEALKQRAKRARNIAYPNAVWEIADEIMHWAEHGPIKNQPRPKVTRQIRRLMPISGRTIWRVIRRSVSLVGFG